jgi:hypothetical protein
MKWLPAIKDVTGVPAVATKEMAGESVLLTIVEPINLTEPLLFVIRKGPSTPFEVSNEFLSSIFTFSPIVTAADDGPGESIISEFSTLRCF